MKKFNFLFAGILAAAMPIAAQDGPVRTDKDAKVIFTQDFEADWQTWSTTAVDTIKGVWYYDVRTEPSASDIPSLSLYPSKSDSIIPLFNGVKLGDDDDVAKGYYDGDSYTILTDADDDFSRREAFAEYGIEGKNYGSHYFQYKAGEYTGSEYQWSNGVSPRYRRNMFVRGLPIEDETSYRLTVYVKANATGSASPRFCADVMRGYANSEKPFSMGWKDDEDLYMSDNTFEYTKDEFSGGWDKVTFMTYYTNDQIADQFMYANSGYYWEDDWVWKIADDDSLQYIKQPDKFFVRLTFSSDSTTYEIDNLSLTKSWIGGVEHYQDMIRVDFGYQTNMDDLAAQAKAKTNIAVVVVPGEYFTVWGYSKQWEQWEEVPINSAEYHGDGYMYMWTKPDEYGGQEFARTFDEYDSVFVSFKNPVDRPDLCLFYNGDVYPKGNDAEWVKNGKLLPDFSNEISNLNPNIGKGVYSIVNLPPVIQGLPYEDGSFGLNGNVRELTLRFSRAIAYDNKGESSDLAFLRVTKSGVKEIWTVKNVTDSTITFLRPESATGNLDGAYKFEFLQLKGAHTDYGDDVICNWEFGTFDTNPDLTPVVSTDWRADGAGYETVPVGLTVWNSNDKVFMGDNTTTGKKNRAFLVNPETSNGFDILMYFSSRGLASGGHLYYGLDSSCPLHLTAGNYTISFYCSTWDTHKCPVTMYLIPREAISITANAVTVSDKDRVAFGTFVPEADLTSANVSGKSAPYGAWDAQSYITLSFEVLTDGDYVIEWNSARVGASSSNSYKYGGLAMSNFEITRNLGLSFIPVSTFNKAMIAAREKRTAASGSDGIYLGSDYTSFDNLIKSFEGWEHTAPSAYAASTAAINAGTAAMQLRMDTVDLFNTTYNAVIDKLGEEALADYTALDAYKALKKLADDNENYDYAAKATPEITSVIGQFNDGIAALDARKALIDKWIVKIGEMEAALNDSLARKGYSEYGDLEVSYNANKNADIIAPSDEKLQEMYEAICAAKNGYVFRCDQVDARTRQIKELFALNKTLGATFDGQEADLKQQIDALMDGDDQLEEMLRAAAIWHLTEALKDKNPVANGLDVSALVPNYYLYTTEKAFEHMRKNSSDMWVLKETTDEMYPHWTVTYGSGNSHPGTAALDSTEAHTYIAGHHLENSAVSAVGTVIEGLPVGYYNVQFDMEKIVGSSAYLRISTDSTALDIKLAKNSTGIQGQDSVLVSEGSKLAAKFDNTSASSSGTYHVNRMSLTMTAPDAAYDYTNAAAAAKNAFTEIRTFVGDVKAAGNVKYYNLNGVQMNAPKAGQIAIRKTILDNGKTVNEKILVK